MRRKLIFQFILIFIFYVKADINSEDSFDEYEWFSRGHLVKAPESRVLSIKRGENGIVLTSGINKNKVITVPNCGKANSGISTRIVGGADAAVGQFPWVVIIQTNGIPFCGGTILNERWIITAAHCFREHKDTETLSIRVGSIDSKRGTEYRIIRIEVHEKYNNDGMENSDLALLKTKSVIRMERDGNINLINGVCLPEKQNEMPKGNTLIVAGWGRTGEYRDPSRLLNYVKLDIIDEVECARKFKIPMDGFPDGYNIYRSQLCASTRRKDACQGDSGGPAIQFQNNRAILLGVVSFGIGCASDFPGVYTKISYFLDWIASHVD